MKKWYRALFIVLILPLAFLFTACDDEIFMHNIEVTSSDSRLGDVSGAGRFQTNSVIELKATPRGSNEFLGWVHKEKLVSKENPIRITVGAATEGKYTAVFDEDNIAWRSFKSATATVSGGITNVNIALKAGQNIDFLTTVWSGDIAIVEDGIGFSELENNFVMNLSRTYDYEIVVTVTENGNLRQFVPKVGKISIIPGSGITTAMNPLTINQITGGTELFKIEFDVSKI